MPCPSSSPSSPVSGVRAPGLHVVVAPISKSVCPGRHRDPPPHPSPAPNCKPNLPPSFSAGSSREQPHCASGCLRLGLAEAWVFPFFLSSEETVQTEVRAACARRSSWPPDPVPGDAKLLFLPPPHPCDPTRPSAAQPGGRKAWAREETGVFGMCREESREPADEGCAGCQRGHLLTPAQSPRELEGRNAHPDGRGCRVRTDRGKRETERETETDRHGERQRGRERDRNGSPRSWPQS